MFIKSLLATLFLTLPLYAEILHESWFEVFMGDKKIGYVAQRYEYEGGNIKSTHYFKSNNNNVSNEVMLKAYSMPDFTPLRYTHTLTEDKVTKITNVKFAGENMEVETILGKEVKKTTKKIRKGTFLSTFLTYIMINTKNEKGQKPTLKANTEFSYSAIAEEDATAANGKSIVKDLEDVKGKKAFKILNDFKSENFFSFVTPDGEVLLTRFPGSNVEVRFAQNKEDAVKGFELKESDVRLLFANRLPGEAAAPEVKKAEPAVTVKPPPTKKTPTK